MERCPVCRARLHDTVCGRCGTDLSGPLAVQRQADSLLRKAVFLWRHQHPETALHLLREAERLHRTPLTSKLLDALAEQVTHQAAQNLVQGKSTEALLSCRKVLAVRKRHFLAKALQGFIQAQRPLN